MQCLFDEEDGDKTQSEELPLSLDIVIKKEKLSDTEFEEEEVKYNVPLPPPTTITGKRKVTNNKEATNHVMISAQGKRSLYQW